ncbi:MAG: VOC family protein [Planctomycetes bacterium]|nr:VOC family protein [Planctomycetota bacterium]
MNASAVPRITNVHHVAYRCFDSNETRHFYEDLLGLPLEAALSFDEISGTDVKLRYLHLFFKLGDGSFIAFFDVPDHDRPDLFKPRSGLNRHIAVEVATAAEQQQFQERLERGGYKVMGPINHGFVQSIYTDDPNGIQVEVTTRLPDYDAVMAHERSIVDQVMTQWNAETRDRKDAMRAKIAKSPLAAS